ncbi:class I SAM-dependent methyltransferase [Immundisolibacter sp.]|uniref:class I SAM-dependent methyltransferase n=1 Tax=Immundisolibacter sp. TaxID=1934948 RepID=UPI003565971A
MRDQREGFERRWRRRFEAWGQQHGSDASIAGWSQSGLEARLANFKRLWSGRIAAGGWLDAGCGAGTYMRSLAGCGVEVVGTDYSLPSLRKARLRLGGAARLFASDVRALPVADGSFEGVLCFGVMQALADPLPALRELCRVVKPGGEVWVDALNRYSAPHLVQGTWRRLRGRPMHMRYDSPWELAALLGRAGAVDVEIHWLPLVPGRWRAARQWMGRPAVRSVLGRVPPLAALASHAVVLRAYRPLVTA